MKKYIPEPTQLTLPFDGIPFGYCRCGCGQLAPIAKKTNHKFGHVIGHPTCFIRGHQVRVLVRKIIPAEIRFWKKVIKAAPDECWLWTGCTISDGYGQLNVDGTLMLAHRYSYELHHGPIPKGIYVLHKCDNPPCCNPAHLFLGTQFDNMDDMTQKGRGYAAKGETNAYAKLTDDIVRDIRKRCDNGEQRGSLATEYNVDKSTIDKVVRRVSWRHIE